VDCHKRGTYQIEPRTYEMLMFELDDECKTIKKLLVIEKYVLGCHIGWMYRREIQSVYGKVAATNIIFTRVELALRG